MIMTHSVRFFRPLAVLFVSLITFVSHISAQHQESASKPTPQLTRTTTRQEVRRLGYAGTVTIIGAPQGSITIEGWTRNEVAITANIELKADTEEDLNRLATVNGFILDDDLNHVRVLTTGTHDREFMRRVAKNFSKKLLGLPWKIDYRIRVPAVTDLEINAGRGPISLKDVEGAIRLSATESETLLTLSGGTVSVTVASGKVGLTIPVRSWRGGGADVRVAAGDVAVELPVGFSGDIDAEILRLGRIDNTFSELQSRERPGITERVIKGRAGAGGPFFKFTVGDGSIVLRRAVASERQ